MFLLIRRQIIKHCIPVLVDVQMLPSFGTILILRDNVYGLPVERYFTNGLAVDITINIQLVRCKTFGRQ